jgi:diadenosine tetraphosphate (Ap4A) HIT family hydrolase
MPETPEELYGRAQQATGTDGRLPLPPLEEWDTFPFEGELRTRPLQPPVDHEPPRDGENPAECWACTHAEAAAIWSNERWLVVPLGRPSGLPVVVLLEPREHLDIEDVTDEQAAELGRLIVRVERAVRQVPGVARVHVGRWGEGSAHLHIWFMGRPFGLAQLRSSFAAIWDDVLPPLPEQIWRENLAIVANALGRG